MTGEVLSIGLVDEPAHQPSARAEAARVAAQGSSDPKAVDPRRLLPGGAWILDAPETPPAVWGLGSEVLWAQGESTIITGPPGVGKTTIEAQLIAGRVGIVDSVLGWAIEPEERGRVLVLAADRPQQIRRAFARVFLEEHRRLLDERLVVWAGPPPADLAANPHLLLQLATDAGARTVFLDSLKDMALGLAEDAVGAGLNRALQTASAAGVEIVALHHQRKGTDGRRPKTLEDLYGSTWISAGAGSVLLLWGQAGDPIVEVHHLKQPSADVGPLTIEHDHDAGTSTVRAGFDLQAELRRAARGLTANDVARLWFETDKPTESQRRKAQRRLDALVASRLAHRDAPSLGGPGGTEPARYHALDETHRDEP